MHSAKVPQVIGVASGKGGVGKTTVSVNLAVALAMRGARVMLLDADLGLANAQLTLGCNAPFNLGHVLHGDKSLEDIIVTASHGVRLVPGASGAREMAALDEGQLASLIRMFDELDEPIDYLVVDVAAGISPSVVSFMAACQRRFVVACDQPVSIADAYGLIKILASEEGLDEIYLLPNLVQNQAQGHRLHRHLNDVTRRFLGFELHYLTSIERDELVHQALDQYRPVVDFAPGSGAARDFRRLAQLVEELAPVAVPSGRIQFLVPRLLHPGTA